MEVNSRGPSVEAQSIQIHLLSESVQGVRREEEIPLWGWKGDITGQSPTKAKETRAQPPAQDTLVR